MLALSTPPRDQESFMAHQVSRELLGLLERESERERVSE